MQQIRVDELIMDSSVLVLVVVLVDGRGVVNRVRLGQDEWWGRGGVGVGMVTWSSSGSFTGSPCASTSISPTWLRGDIIKE